MRVYVDTNIVLDYLKSRSSKFLPFDDFAGQIFERCRSCEFFIVISDLVVRELQTQVSSEHIAEFILMLGEKIVVANTILADDFNHADLHYPDTVHIGCAKRLGCSTLITGDKIMLNYKDSALILVSSQFFE